MTNQNKKVIEHSKEIINKNNERTRKILNAPVKEKRKSVKINLILSILLILISIFLLVIKLGILGRGILILSIISFCVNLYLLNRYKNV